MTVTLILVGFLFLAYYLGCVIYAGVGTSFLWIWLLAGLLCLAGAFFLMHMHRQNPEWQMPSAVRYGLRSVLIVAAAFLVFLEGFICLHMYDKGDRGLDYVIILGAQVKGSVPSRALNDRINKAVEYLERNQKTIAILSGGQGKGEDISEAQCMHDILVDAGIDADRLRMEDASTSTEENMQYSFEMIENKEASVGIITNNFHVFRATAIAKKMWSGQISGIAAESHSLLQVHFMLREALAIVKDTLTGNMSWK